MALANEIAEHLKCPIHLEIFEEPMILPCIHVLCKIDVDRLTKENGRLKCPVCNEVCLATDTKKDFRIQNLIDLHKQTTAARSLTENRKRCEFCDKEVATCKCKECNMFFGEQCKIGHLKMAPSKHHHVLPIIDPRDKINEIVELECAKMDSLESFYRAKREALNPDTKPGGSSIMEEINASMNRMTEEVRRHHDEIRTRAKSAIDKKKSRVKQVLSEHDAFLQNFHKLSENLKELVQKDAIVEKEFRNLMLESTKMQMKMESLANWRLSPNLGLRFNNSAFLEEELEKVKLDEISMFKNTTSLQIFVSKRLTQKAYYSFTGGKALALSVIGSETWITMQIENGTKKCILAVNFETNPAKRKKRLIAIHYVHVTPWGTVYKSIYSPCKVVQALGGTIIAACDGVLNTDEDTKNSLGLVIVDKNGSIKSVIENTPCQDINICSSSNFVIVLTSCTVPKIMIFRQKTSPGQVPTWSIFKTIDTNYGQWTHVCMFNYKIILSSSKERHMIFWDRQTGKTVPIFEKSAIKRKKSAIVTYCDTDGNFVICDFEDSAIKILTPENNFKDIPVTITAEPRYAACDNEGQLCFVDAKT